MSQKIDPKQIKTTGANTGDVLVYDAATGSLKLVPSLGKYRVMRNSMIFGGK